MVATPFCVGVVLLSVLLQRLMITSLVCLLLLLTTRSLVAPRDDVWLAHARLQFLWLFALTAWSLIVRIGLRRGLLLPESPRLVLFATEEELAVILHAWARVSPARQLQPILPSALEQLLDDESLPLLVALSPQRRSDPSLTGLIERLETQNPEQVQTISVRNLFEQQQQRLPPALLSDFSVMYDELPWAASFSFQSQLKRLADLLVASVLLFFTSPFVVFAALLIWLEDQGPVFYTQLRSGWLGRPFKVLKLRTMRVQTTVGPALWTQPGDPRITRVGQWLRRLRLDELPQLLNVLNGDMSLIGPRPERPELEHDLVQHIPHYRKRHWMRPGLSGWAQVCAPYASSIEDSDLKLSYDLFYILHFSVLLDFLILIRTIKTVLKAGGR